MKKKKTPIVIASDNVHKSQELQSILEQENFPVILQTQLKVKPAAETGLTFVENAILKARNACQQTNLPAIADDSGLETDVLFGRPGVYSARYAGSFATDRDNIAKLLEELYCVPESERTARYHCVIVFLKFFNDPTPIICQGTWEGKITLSPAGKNGFGYDPVFWLPDFSCTVAEILPEIKNKISHRAQAIQKLIETLKMNKIT